MHVVPLISSALTGLTHYDKPGYCAWIPSGFPPSPPSDWLKEMTDELNMRHFTKYTYCINSQYRLNWFPNSITAEGMGKPWGSERPREGGSLPLTRVLIKPHISSVSALLVGELTTLSALWTPRMVKTAPCYFAKYDTIKIKRLASTEGPLGEPGKSNRRWTLWPVAEGLFLSPIH